MASEQALGYRRSGDHESNQREPQSGQQAARSSAVVFLHACQYMQRSACMRSATVPQPARRALRAEHEHDAVFQGLLSMSPGWFMSLVSFVSSGWFMSPGSFISVPPMSVAPSWFRAG